MKPIILVFIHHYLPGDKSGGPVRTIANIVDALKSDFDFKIITSDRDALDFSPYKGIEIDEWNETNGASVLYMSHKRWKILSFFLLLKEIEHDIVYLNSFFDTSFTLGPLITLWCLKKVRKPIIIAPRGELSDGAISIKKAKKTIFISIMKILGIYDNLIWQASSDYEAVEIRKVMKGIANDVRVAPNIPSAGTDKLQLRRKSSVSAIKIIFFSRISPKKNLDYALNIIARVKTKVIFDIYGPISDKKYWGECDKIMKNLPKNINAKYCGRILHEKAADVLAEYDFMFLPTRSENFGHVIYESLNAGTPVLISDKTPWQQSAKGSCMAVSLNNEELFVKYIERFVLFSEEDVIELRKEAMSLANEFIQKQKPAEKTRDMFYEMIRRNKE